MCPNESRLVLCHFWGQFVVTTVSSTEMTPEGQASEFPDTCTYSPDGCTSRSDHQDKNESQDQGSPDRTSCAGESRVDLDVVGCSTNDDEIHMDAKCPDVEESMSHSEVTKSFREHIQDKSVSDAKESESGLCVDSALKKHAMEDNKDSEMHGHFHDKAQGEQELPENDSTNIKKETIKDVEGVDTYLDLDLSEKDKTKYQRSDNDGKETEDDGQCDNNIDDNCIDNADDNSGAPIDRGWAWMVALGCFVQFFVYTGHFQTLAVLLQDLLLDLDISLPAVTVLLSLGSLVYCLATQVSANILVTLTSVRILATTAAVVNISMTLLFVAAPNPPVFFMSTLLKFTAKGVTLVSTLTLVGFYFKKRRGLAIALGLIGMSASIMTVSPLVRYFRDEFGLRGGFLLFAAVEMHGIVAALLLRPMENSKSKNQRSKDNEPDVNQPLILDKVRPEGEEEGQESHVTNPLNQVGISMSNISEVIVEEVNDPKMDIAHCSPSCSPTLKFTALRPPLLGHVLADSKGSGQLVNVGGPVTTGHRTMSPFTNGVSGNLTALTLTSEIKGSTSSIAHPVGVRDSHSNVSNCPPSPTDTTQILTRRDARRSGRITQRSVSREMDRTSNWSLVAASLMGSVMTLVPIQETEIGTAESEVKSKPSKARTFLRAIMDTSLLKNFLCIMVVTVYSMNGTGNFNAIYLPSYATQVGVTPQNAAMLLSILGACDMAGRIFFGFVADLRVLRPNVVIAISSLILGLMCQFAALLVTFESLVFFAVMQGFFGCVGQNLNSVLIVDVVGIQFLAKMLAVCSFFTSVATAVQHPIQGALIEVTGSYIATFSYAGTAFILAAILLFSEPFLRRAQETRERRSIVK